MDVSVNYWQEGSIWVSNTALSCLGLLSRWSILIHIILYNFPESSWPQRLDQPELIHMICLWNCGWTLQLLMTSFKVSARPFKASRWREPVLARQWWMDIINVVHLFTFTLQSWKMRGQQQKGNAAYNCTPISESHPMSFSSIRRLWWALFVHPADLSWNNYETFIYFLFFM